MSKSIPIVPRIYVKDVSLLWTLLWIASHHPIPHAIRQAIESRCPVNRIKELPL